jgi:sulfate permease, SulP family
MSPLTSILVKDAQQPPPKLLPNVLAGLTVGLVSLTYSVSFAALIFTGNLSPQFPQGVGSALITSAIVGAIVALRSSFPFAIAGPDSTATAAIALMTAAIAAEIQPSPGGAERLFPTVWMAIALSTCLTGILLYAVGRMRLGRWARFIPYPVMGGFLAGTGLLITCSSFTVMAGVRLGWKELPQLCQSATMMHWLPGVLFAAVSIGVTKIYPQPLLLPAMLLGTIVSFNLLWQAIGLFVPLNPHGWFLEAVAGDKLWHFWTAASFSQVDWQVLLGHLGASIVLVVVVVITLLLNITGVELATQQDTTLDGELRTNGIANIVVCLSGGMVGHLSLNRTLLHRSAGADSRIAGLTAAAFSGAVLLCGSVIMAYIPLFVLGGLLLTIGVKLLHEWVIRAWFRFSHLDYALILLILTIIAIWGFLSGIGIGIVAACTLFVLSYSRHQAIRHTFSGATHSSNVGRSVAQQRLLRQQGDRLHMLILQGYLFFGTANTLLESVSGRLRDPTLPPIEFVILDFRLVSGLDASAVLSFIKMRQLAHKHEVRLVFTQLHPNIFQKLQQGDCIQTQNDLIQVFDRLDGGIEWCEERILETRSLRRPRILPLALQLGDIFTDPNQVASFMSYLYKIQVEIDCPLFNQGESPETLYFIESGRVTESGRLQHGQTRRWQTLGAGNIVGENSFYLGTPHQTAAIAELPTTLYCLSRSHLQTMRQEHPQVVTVFEDFIIRFLVERLMYAHTDIEELLRSIS